VQQYNKEKARIFNEKTLNNEKNREVLSLRLLEGHLEEFKPNLSKEKEEVSAFGIKKELYRPLQEILGCLALWYELKEQSTYRRIDELVRMGKFSSKGGKNLKQAIDKALSLRVEAHLFYKDEQEYLCHHQEGKEDDKNLFYFEGRHLRTLDEIYRVLLPFHECAREFKRTKDLRVFAKEKFYDERAEERAEDLEKDLQFKGAQAANQQAVALNPNDIDALKRLAHSEEQLGANEEALAHLQKALEIAKRKYGETHPAVASCYNSIAISLDNLGKSQQALECEEKALTILCNLYGEEHTDVASCYISMGISLSLLGKIEQALNYEKKALKILLDLHGEEHADVASCYNSISISLCRLGHHGQAVESGQKALKILLNLYGSEKHPGIASCHNTIGNAYSSWGKIEETHQHLQKALSIRLALYGEDHPDVKLSRRDIQICLRRQSKQ